jgi:hypothetical protein
VRKSLGGSFTQPIDDIHTNEIHYEVYHKWEKIGEYDNDAEATQALLEAVLEDERILVGVGTSR